MLMLLIAVLKPRRLPLYQQSINVVIVKQEQKAGFGIPQLLALILMANLSLK
jgi:hypothetical protein